MTATIKLTHRPPHTVSCVCMCGVKSGLITSQVQNKIYEIKSPCCWSVCPELPHPEQPISNISQDQPSRIPTLALDFCDSTGENHGGSVFLHMPPFTQCKDTSS